MIDSDVTGNFILEEIAKKKEFFRVKKKDLYDLVIVDKSLLLSRDRKIKEETILR